MPKKAKGYTTSQKNLQALRDYGVLSPSEIDAMFSDNSTKSRKIEGRALGVSGHAEAGEKQRGYKYFPDNP